MIAPTLLKAILKFCTPNKLFKYFRRRYNDYQLKDLNNMVKIRGKIRTLQLSNAVLKECIAKRVSPRYISIHVKNSQARPSPTMERAFINDEIGKNREKLVRLLRKLDVLRLKTPKFLTFFNWVRFSRYVAEVEERKRNQIKTKHIETLNWLVKQRFGSVSNSRNNICNLSAYVLSDTEKFVLSHGLDFCLPPTNVKREKIFAEFEVLMGQLFHHSSKSKECLSALKAKVNHLAHAFCGTQIDLTDFTMHRECFDVIKSLRSNDKIIITKPDKGSGVVILNKSDYITKINLIFNNASKFQQIGPANTNNNTAKIEAKIAAVTAVL